MIKKITLTLLVILIFILIHRMFAEGRWLIEPTHYNGELTLPSTFLFKF